ncbi:MAG: glycosyltransferase [Bacteroidetes bacterium]|nr:glycosyltransferase [Bacteroidota bacterium]
MSVQTVDISVIMPVYNGEKYLREAIDSVLNQTFKTFEFIIVNDGSTDATESIITSYTDPRIRLINQANGGVARALNTGLRYATASYVVRFDADDVCMPHRFQVQYQYMQEHPDCMIVGSDANYMNEQGEFLFRYRNEAYTDEAIKRKTPFSCPFIHSSVMYKKAPVLAAGAYNEHAHNFEDHLLWVNLLKQGTAFNLSEVLLHVRFNISSVTIDEKDRGKKFMEIKHKALQTGTISAEEGDTLLKIIRSQSRREKEHSYHRMLAKKYLWNNYNTTKAREHLSKAISLRPSQWSSYALYILSFLPEKQIQALYHALK